jgi:branched-chain amino acid transport system substrate-binding protein
MSARPITIGYCLSLTGPLASNGRAARLAHEIWERDVNRKGGLLGRPVQMICVDDETDPTKVPDIYRRLLDDEKVDLVVGGYGDNSVAPAMPIVIERNRYFVTLMALASNTSHNYANFFVMIPTGPRPGEGLTEGFFELAAAQQPKPETMAILAADALFAKSPVAGAKTHANTHGFHIITDDEYDLSTTDFGPIISKLKMADPDILFMCSYLNDTIGILQAVDAAGLTPKMIGGAMIGPQNGGVKSALGPLLNGVVNYEYWLPAPKMMYPGIGEMIGEYQLRAGAVGADPLGYYVAPQAYAQMQIVEQAITGTASLDDEKLAQFTREKSFSTILGDVKFGAGGAWTEARVLQVQYRDIPDNDLANFKDTRTQAVVWPSQLASQTLIYPYARAKQKTGTRPE